MKEREKRKGRAPKPTVGVIGKGNMGRALTEALERAGYPVRPSGRALEEQRGAVAASSAIILAVPWSEAEVAVQRIAGDLRGKTLVDLTNLLGPNMSYSGQLERSGAEKLQALAAGAHVVKAFNTVFSAHIASGAIGGERLTVFVAGDDEGAKRTVGELAKDLGFEVADAGPLRNATWLEALGYLNIALGATLGWEHGFRLLRSEGRPAP